MDLHVSPSLFSRILLAIMGLALIVMAYWFITTALTPVPVPPVPPAKGAVSFDAKADVSKDALFQRLRPLAPSTVDVGATGRLNPFVPPAPTPVVVSSTATTTVPSATSTETMQSPSTTNPTTP